MKLFLITLFVFIIHLPTFACKCSNNNTVNDEIRQSDLVLTGKVVNKENIFHIDPNNGSRYGNLKFTIAVKRIYKGEITEKIIEIVTGEGGGDCGFDFEVGQDYIIYAYYRNQIYPSGPKVDKFIWTNTCTKTKKTNQNELEEIQKAVKQIRKKS